jgi:hypothetical protein
MRRLGIAPPAGAAEWEAKTIHRVLGYRPDSGRFRHDAHGRFLATSSSSTKRR